MKRIGVFLSSHSHLPDSYYRAAEEVGAWIGRTGRTLVYGGARKGLMEVLATAVDAHGGEVVGVVPQVLHDGGMVSDRCHVTFLTADLHDRKAALMRESDIVVALPGGVGTLDEVFTVWASATLGLTALRIVLYNVDGCWDALLHLLDDLQRQGVIAAEQRRSLSVVDSIDALDTLCS